MNFKVIAGGEILVKKKKEKNERYFLNVNLGATENEFLVKPGQEQV